jgi:Ca2+-binding RTX toxin-like protein
MTTFYGTDVSDFEATGSFRSLYGGEGADFLAGGLAGRFIYGGGGNDALWGNAIGGQLTGNGSLQKPYAISTIDPVTLAVLIEGGPGNDLVAGSVKADTLYGGDGNDSGTILVHSFTDQYWLAGIFGGAGSDYLDGGRGNDLLVGGTGKDMLVGGLGADTFQFSRDPVSHVMDSVTGSGRDVIRDFSHAEHDKIDLAKLDAKTTVSGDQAFSFIATSAFHHTAGELRYTVTTSQTIVEGDVNGDGKADFQIGLTGHVSLIKGDFVL